MDLILASKKADKIIMEVEGVGGYYGWSSSQFPLLSQKKLAAGLFLLQPHAFVQPYYSVSSKIAYVCQGECIVGLISSEDSKEEVIKLQKGDTLPLTMKEVSWWYNDGESKLEIIFLGEYDDEYTPGEYCGFFLTGFTGILNGFSNELIAKSFHMTKPEIEKLIKEETSCNIIIKIKEDTKMPEPCNKNAKHELVFNLDSAEHCTVQVKNGGILSAVTCRNLPLLRDIGLSANHVVLEGGALFGPVFTADLSVQLSYVTKGSGRVQIVGPLRKVVLDTKVKEGELFFVPKFFPFVVEADEGGMEFFSVITSSKQVYGGLSGGKNSIWKAISPSVLEASLNVTESFKSKIAKGAVIAPPSTI
ncbi:13S globulin seed storage protein-like [Solanum lycopersicum]|uniref:13S globulin seed storage protein-like n=1 Tax=Solanum lycopersicum TaxID=4081 RepID=UPI00027687A4|nr:13S globulin seed storage protein 2-like [Solanum lycopersicum]